MEEFYGKTITQIKNELQDNYELRVGGEYKIKQWSVRGGYRFEQSPYKTDYAFGDLFIRFKCVNKTKITPEIIEVLTKVFPPLLVIPDVKESDIIEKKLETVTESDLEFLESDSDEYDSEEEFTDSESEEESE